MKAGDIISFDPRSNAHMTLPKIKPAALDGGPLEQVGGDTLKLWPGERLRIRAVRSGGVIAEFMRQLVLVPEYDFVVIEEGAAL